MTANPDRVVKLEIPHPELASDLNTPGDLDRWHRRARSILKVRLFAVAKERAGAPRSKSSSPCRRPSPIFAWPSPCNTRRLRLWLPA